MQNLLFLCSRNKLRSPTAEAVLSTWEDIECDSAGLLPDADLVLSSEQIDWADIIFVMELSHRRKLARRYKEKLHGKRVIVLGIPDRYAFMDPALVALLESKVPQFLR